MALLQILEATWRRETTKTLQIGAIFENIFNQPDTEAILPGFQDNFTHKSDFTQHNLMIDITATKITHESNSGSRN